MKLVTFEAPGHSGRAVGIVQDDRVVAFGGPDGVREALAAGRVPGPSGGTWPLADVKLLAPIPVPGTIYAIGLNYADHIAEMGDTPPERPIVFVKVSGSVAPPGGPIVCPEVVRRLDYEGELVDRDGRPRRDRRLLRRRRRQRPRPAGARAAVDAGQGRRHVLPVRALGHHRRRGPRPGEPGAAHLGQRRAAPGQQHLQPVFGCSALVEFISQTCTLRPGDLILTGTPGGVGQAQDPPRFLQSGDRVRIAIDGLGEIEHPVQ